MDRWIFFWYCLKLIINDCMGHAILSLVRSEDLPYQTTASTIFTAVFGLEFVLKLLAQVRHEYLDR